MDEVSLSFCVDIFALGLNLSYFLDAIGFLKKLKFSVVDKVEIMIKYNIITIIAILGFGQGVFLAIVLATSKQNRQSNRILSIFMLIQAVVLASNCVFSPDVQLNLPHLLRIDWPLSMAFGPIFYFYYSSILEKNFKFKAYHILLFIPFFLSVLFLMPLFVLDGPTKTDILNASHNGRTPSSLTSYSWSFKYLVPALQIQMAIYCGICIQRIKKYRKELYNYKSNISKESLSWLLYLSIIMIITHLFNLVGFTATVFFGNKIVHHSYLSDSLGAMVARNIAPLEFALLTYMIGYKALKQSELSMIREITKTQRKYEKSSLTDEESKTIMSELSTIMTEEKAYMDSELNIVSLAEKLSISRHHLSQVINRQTGKNFYEYINNYRINEIIFMLQSGFNENKNILDVAYRSGFDSKSAFYKYFRKITGMSPREYITTNKMNNLQ